MPPVPRTGVGKHRAPEGALRPSPDGLPRLDGWLRAEVALRGGEKTAPAHFSHRPPLRPRRNVNVPFSHPTGGKAQWDGRKVRSRDKGTFTSSTDVDDRRGLPGALRTPLESIILVRDALSGRIALETRWRARARVLFLILLGAFVATSSLRWSARRLMGTGLGRAEARRAGADRGGGAGPVPASTRGRLPEAPSLFGAPLFTSHSSGAPASPAPTSGPWRARRRPPDPCGARAAARRRQGGPDILRPTAL